MEAIDWLDKLVNIVILGYGLPKIESECIASVIEHTKNPYYISYVDNKNTGKTLTQMWNMMLEISGATYTCLLNSDTVVTPNWLTKMVETLESDNKIGFVGPSTNNCHSPQKTITFDQAKEMPRTEEVMKDPISGFCLVFPTMLRNIIGSFNEQYNFYGQESDYIDRAKQEGYKCVWRKDAFVWHIGEASVKTSDMDVKQEREKAKKIYWSNRNGN